jgi:hypothetical protein
VAKIRRIVVQGQSSQIVPETPISKITRAKWSRGVAQVVEHLLCQNIYVYYMLIQTKIREHVSKIINEGKIREELGPGGGP